MLPESGIMSVSMINVELRQAANAPFSFMPYRWGSSFTVEGYFNLPNYNWSKEGISLEEFYGAYHYNSVS